MATAPSKSRCSICDKEKRAVRCEGCLQLFCYDHLTDHRQELNKQLDYIEHTRDLFRENLGEQLNHPQISLFAKQIDDWEEDAIQTVRQAAAECRQVLVQHTAKNVHSIEATLASLSDHIRRIRQENDFNEIDLDLFNQKLKKLAAKLSNLPNITVKQDPAPLIHRFSIAVSTAEAIACPKVPPTAPKWGPYGSTIAGTNYPGPQPNQLCNPLGLFVDDGDPPAHFIADHGNHRIVKWRCGMTDGEVVAGGTGQGNRSNQLNYPTDVIFDKMSDSLIICDQGNKRVMQWPRNFQSEPRVLIDKIVCWGVGMDNNGDLYFSDYENDEVRRWKEGDRVGTLVAGGNGRGNQLNQLNYPSFIFVDDDYSVYVSDSNNNRVVKWAKDAKEGIVVAGGQGQGDRSTQLSNPQGIVVDQFGYVYVADSHNHRIVRWAPGASAGSVVAGGNGQGARPNQFNCPLGLSFDRYGNLCVIDWGNNRVQKFHLDA